MVKDSSNLASFYGSYINGIVCEKKIGLEPARTLKKYWNFLKMSSDINFTVTSWFLGNVFEKPYFNTQCPDLDNSVHPVVTSGGQIMPKKLLFYILPGFSKLPTTLYIGVAHVAVFVLTIA